MIRIYHTDLHTNETVLVEEIKKGCWINLVNPSQHEINFVCEKVGMQSSFIHYALDYEEKARIDVEDDDGTILYIIDTPTIEKREDVDMYTTVPLGIIIVRDEFFITVALRSNKVIKEFEKQGLKSIQTYKKSKFLLQILYTNSAMFLKYLKEINKEAEVTEHTLKNSTRNEELLKMMNLEKSLVYFQTSLKSNEVVMERTMRGKFIKLYEEDEDLLDDAIIENKQAIEMAKIYNDILNSTTDTYASIISNNLNDVMKFLTSITVILAVPTMISSFWGMNVILPLAHNVFGFLVMVLISILLTVAVTCWLKKKNFLN